MLIDEEWKKYPVGSIGYYKSMEAYIIPEHLRHRYNQSHRNTEDLKLKKAIKVNVKRIK